MTDAKDFVVETRTGKRVLRLKKIFNGVGRKRHNKPNVLCAKISRDKTSSQKTFPQTERFKQSAKSSFETCEVGVEIVEVDRYFASSQICHSCGYKNSELKDLKIRQWTCPQCCVEHDRDTNAAINILKNGLGQRPLQETL